MGFHLGGPGLVFIGECSLTTNPIAFIIEDDVLVLPIYQAAIQDALYEVFAFQNGASALEQLNVMNPVLVILDMRLPGVPGINILQMIKSEERFENTRVIVVSADTTLTEYIREKADLVLLKPVGYNQLRELAARLRPEDI
jgi:DNA-binding response OmpR family regulator